VQEISSLRPATLLSSFVENEFLKFVVLSTTEMARHHLFHFVNSARKVWFYVWQIRSHIKRFDSQQTI
jgi:hypothetical protein